MITSENVNFLDEITKKFINFRAVLNDTEDDDSCLCRGCLSECQKITLNQCSSHNKFLCYVEDGKCKTEASINFCNKCQISEDGLKRDFTHFKYQLFLEDYMKKLNNINPNKANSRGLLIFHGLGSGKTCSGLLLSESCRRYEGNKVRKVILMIPASLNLEPWIKELSKKCNKNYELSKKLKKAIKNNEDKSDMEQKKIYRNICEKEGYYIVHYNAENITGGWRDVLKKIPTRKDSKNPFDDSVIIIDEVHNFVNSITDENIQQKNDKQMTKRDVYNQIFFAKNAKVILLTGTPVFNKPVELAYIFNMVRGFIHNKKILFDTDEKEFNKMFLTKKNGSEYQFINPNMFRRRINGLVSYYKGANENQFASKIEDDLYIPFSKEQHDNYMEIYKIEQELSKDDDFINDSARIKQNTAMISNVSLPKFIFDMNLQKNYKNIKGNHITKNNIKFIIDIKQRKLKNKILPSLVNKDNYDNVLKLLDNDKKPLNINNDLHKISRKMYHALKRINLSKGPVVFFSQFEGIYGISMFAEVLNQNGFVNFDKLKDGIDELKYKRDSGGIIGSYMLWTGTHKLNATRKIYNSFENRDGSIIKCFLMTKAGKEGINLLAVRQIHILEPWWNNVIKNQVIGRGIRMCSHNHIPSSQFQDLRIDEENREDGKRLVNIFKYYGVPDLRPSEYIKTGIISRELIPKILEAQKEMKKKSTDFIISNVANKKTKIEMLFVKLMKDVAIDCNINKLINNRIEECFVDYNYEYYFDAWDIRDNDVVAEREADDFELIKIKGKYYWKDFKNNIYNRDSAEGNLLSPANVEYKPIGTFINNEIKFNYSDIILDIDEGESKYPNDISKYLKDEMTYNLFGKKVLFISDRIRVLYDFLQAGAKVSIYEEFIDEETKINMI